MTRPVLRLLTATILLVTGCAAAAPGPGPAPEEPGVAAADPLASTLRIYLGVLAPGAPAADTAGFLAAHPDWPNQPLLKARYDAALVADADDGAAAVQCLARPASSAAAVLRCATALASQGDAAGAGALARTAWRDGIDAAARDGAAETSFLQRWGGVLTPDDGWARFERLGFPHGNASEAAAREAVRLTGTRRAVALARVALASGTAPDPLALFGAVPADGQDDPALVLLVARQLRRLGQNDAALGFWRDRALRVEASEPPAMQQSFWSERDLLARALLASPGRDADAFTMADDGANASVSARGDALFLSGWVALRRLAQPTLAAGRFASLGAMSASVTTRARAAYWLARAEAAEGDAAASLREETVAARLPTTFYGQLALRALAPQEGRSAYLDRLRTALTDTAGPAWTQAQALSFAAGEMPRAAVLLVAWGQARQAKAFLGAADMRAVDPVGHALAADLALTLGLPDEAVAIARRAGRDGRPMPVLGWPRPFTPPAGLPAPLLLGVMRQESGFDTAAASPSGALGLMQLMPATASGVARAHGVPFGSASMLTADPGLNMRLGAAYLEGLLSRFGGNVAVAVAAYNAGPHRVAGWPAAPPSPPDAASLDLPDDAAVDWIEGIPVSETRNYVQRVLENQGVYAAEGAPSAGAG